jgi:hypothetical protein
MANMLIVGCIAFLLCQVFPNQREKKEERRFVVGFELSAEKGMNLAWPLEAMPASRYRSILMVVERMPRIYKGEGNRRFWEYLSVHRHLSVNGQALPAGNSALRDALTYPQEFVVDLRDGRLFLSLTFPPGQSIDPQHKSAVIKLFEIPPRGPGSACPLTPQQLWEQATQSPNSRLYDSFFIQAIWGLSSLSL